MKIGAVASRGTRRDFVDLYFASERYGFSHLLDLFDRKYAEVRYSRIHVLKSFAYYVDAERDPMPDMLVAVSGIRSPWRKYRGSRAWVSRCER